MEQPLIRHSIPSIHEDDIKAVTAVLNSTHLEEGEQVRELEAFFRVKFGKKQALAVSSGFAGIHLSLIALGITEGDEVIIPSYSCSALLNPVLLLGATPRIADCHENSFNISLTEIEPLINHRTKAIIVPHIFGFPANIKEIVASGIPVIEDCAQSTGGSKEGKLLGTFGKTGVFSFYASKMIASGDGGMIITDDDAIAEKITNYRYYGHKRMHKFVAYNYHLTNLPAALALSQMKKLDSFLQKRQAIASFYDESFSGNKEISFDFENKEFSCFYRYPVKLNKDIEEIKNKMLGSGIQCGYGVLEGIHQLLEQNNADFPNTSYNLKTILSLPIYPSLTDQEVEKVASALLSATN